ncbi:hypothetical protein K432DRAFT_379259 [Lepidopterella palustris CBS 459.81]|uniref:Kelch repeat protein n=1 Tax=Lepidopterella palustris CBS 459.81 TaxID=1314670 RepID=A0A8E2EH23_9PEZI|nr:hypothetical protein K432DRAFT_379259 [Lepidopterella palustris CBS 459.81]
MDKALPSTQRRKSVFVEVGLVDEQTTERQRQSPILISQPSPMRTRPVQRVRFQSQNDICEEEYKNENEGEDIEEDGSESVATEDYGTLSSTTFRPYLHMETYSRLFRLGMFALLLAIALPSSQNNPITGDNKHVLFGAKGGVIPSRPEGLEKDTVLLRRDKSPTDICKRWSHQTAVVNGTLYIYGGRATTDAQQNSNTWNNDFLTLDLTKSWQISSPSLTGLAQPSGPPAVANAYLWNSYTSLFLYGGEFSDAPVTSPVAFAMWEYNIHSSSWIEHSNPQTSSGSNAEADGQAIQRAAEGAGFSVTTLGRGWYFGGHLDYLTTLGWSIDVARVYLKSLVEFTYPGFSNDAVNTLSGGKTAGSDGVWRNVTQGGLQDEAGFTERADGLLLYIPGFGSEGILLGLTGGTNATFTQMNVIDVYDIANSTWYKQSTSGKTPEYRVNPCAVVAAAADGSSYNVYMFGGQNLQPYENQTQYSDMWILSIPSFTWISVDTSSQSVPYARAGHSCNIWDGQMIVVGGYVGQELSCDSPGIYVFNMSSLQWSNQFTALTGAAATQVWTGKQGDTANPLAQQANQRGFNASAGLEGSYGYSVPAVVQSIIGGDATGGATLTAPVQTATSGPLATGKPITYTVTASNGATVTETATPSNNGGGNSNGKSTRNASIGAIVAGVVAAVFALIAAYFAFCTWLYRKQLALYKNHAAMAQRAAADPARAEKDAFILPPPSTKDSSERRGGDTGSAINSTSGSGPSGRDGSGMRSGSIGVGVDGIAVIGASGGGRNDGGRGSLGRRSSAASSTEDLLAGQEPTFWGARGVLLNPRRSLRVINRD